MNFEQFILTDNLDYYHCNKPLQSVYLHFVRQSPDAILELGEFEALRRWLLSTNVVIPMPIKPEESHRITREFYKALRKEQKGK